MLVLESRIPRHLSWIVCRFLSYCWMPDPMPQGRWDCACSQAFPVFLHQLSFPIDSGHGVILVQALSALVRRSRGRRCLRFGAAHDRRTRSVAVSCNILRTDRVRREHGDPSWNEASMIPPYLTALRYRRFHRVQAALLPSAGLRNLLSPWPACLTHPYCPRRCPCRSSW